ncbi:cytochrome d ubiquinol oxidase subunit I [Thermosporothrix hazakensis]|jgi:cytochrome d ubiquinol oxidase subunit I|uniref:Cytochrome d ubiquinol oxidase subunit I n=2 Tax=Thermosporothrix TaxID=768650 RepID=A0A326UA44_THEHA|nr:cytochrome ubiquinol oxidase subunit I [Thermosporothrix hazakensis]PZW32004.1 cytochrome d ubiquinol oxidase subunit I [Thermosporothrix hazakensis]BBH91524.1 cytochrome ubiquinol oxidase subunit I [Thermosporothrix sp. COM3]GCE49670.1 cytochrome ubiquinol oxidase subunit I [Thermosporothrix hazakensis]
MDALTLARWQFAITTVYHFFFVPLTIGLSLIVAIIETMYARTGNLLYKRMATFWGRLFLINFAMGVVTGIVQEFQFGMNWSDYSRFVGDIFGAPLAIEALLTFFLESTFIGLWIFGRDKLPKMVLAASIWLVFIGTVLSSFWILTANSFMQNPVGFVMHNGRAEMHDFVALVSNPNLWSQFPHVVLGALTTGAFFVLGISAYQLLRRTKQQQFFRTSIKVALPVAIIATILVAGTGHMQAQYKVQSQPMKMAAAEALWHAEDPAPFLLFSFIDENNKKNTFSLEVPAGLSLLSYNSPSGQVMGIHELQAQYEQTYGPGNYIPPVALTFWTFRAMVAAGILMIVLSLLTLFFMKRKSLEKHRWFLWVLLFALALPYIANSTGWIMAEVGRQPWVVQNLLQTASAVSPTVSAASVLTSLIAFTLLYGVLAGVDVFLLSRYANKLEDETPITPKEQSRPNEHILLAPKLS